MCHLLQLSNTAFTTIDMYIKQKNNLATFAFILQTRVPEMSIGLDLDWIRTIANFVEFGLDPGCKSLQNLGSGPDGFGLS